MSINYLLGNSFSYAKNGFVENPMKWLILIVLSLLQVIPAIGFVLFLIFMGINPESFIKNLPLILGALAGSIIFMWIFNALYQGFLVQILKGESNLPDFPPIGVLFADGIKFTIIQIIYFMIPGLILIWTIYIAIMSALSGNILNNTSALITLIGTVFLGIAISCILTIILSLFWIIGSVRFARTGSIGQAFGIREILGTIQKIGWVNYILALVVLVISLIIYGFCIAIIQTGF